MCLIEEFVKDKSPGHIAFNVQTIKSAFDAAELPVLGAYSRWCMRIGIKITACRAYATTFRACGIATCSMPKLSTIHVGMSVLNVIIDVEES